MMSTIHSLTYLDRPIHVFLKLNVVVKEVVW